MLPFCYGGVFFQGDALSKSFTQEHCILGFLLQCSVVGASTAIMECVCAYNRKPLVDPHHSVVVCVQCRNPVVLGHDSSLVKKSLLPSSRPMQPLSGPVNRIGRNS